MKLFLNTSIAMLCLMLLSISNLSAQNQRIPFQGTLYEAGTAVNTPVNITFTIADPAWTETHSNVSVTQGVYAVVLGDMTPFPDDMFTTGTPQMVINIGGTDVATVDLHAPYISEAIVSQNMPGEINRTFDEDGAEFNGLTMVVDGAGDAQTAAFEGVAQTDTQNTGVEGFAISGSGNTDFQYGLYGQATGDGTGNHRGVMGYGAGGGQYNHGVKGIANGAGSGVESQDYGVGSVNFGVEGNASGNTWNNTGIEGSNYGTEGKWNFGVHGISNAGTGATVENHGVAGRAYGSGVNIGIYGTAADGAENYAGVFDGDVNINGELMVNGESINSLTALPDTLNALNESTDPGKHSAIEGVSKSTGWNTGVDGYAESLSGNAEKQNGVYGTATGTGDGDHRGVVGSAAGAGKYNKGIFGIGQGAGNGDSGTNFGEGSINFGVEGIAGGNAWNNTGVEGSNFGTDGEWNFGVHGISNAGSGTTVENHGVAGRAFGSGINYGIYGYADGGEENYAGFFEGDVLVNNAMLRMNNSNGDEIISIREFGSGGGTLFAFNEIGANTAWFGNDGSGDGFMQIVNYNEAGDDSDGAILAGFWGDGVPKIYLETTNNNEKARITSSDETGFIYVKGQSGTRTAQLGSQWWDGNHDLGYMVVYGSDEADKVMMKAISHDTDQEMGEITLSSTDGSSFTINAHGLGKSTNGVFGTETNDYVNIGAKEWEGNNGDQRGFIHLSGTEDGIGDSQRIFLDVDDYGNGSFGSLGLKNYVDDGGNGGTVTVSLNGENGDATFNGNVVAGSFESNGDYKTLNDNDANVGWFGRNGNDGYARLLSFDDSENYTGAAIVGSFIDGSNPEFYLEGSKQSFFGLARLRIEPVGTEEAGRLELNTSNNGSSFVASNKDLGSGNYSGSLDLNTNQTNDSKMSITSGGINMGQNAYADGIVMNYDNSGGAVLEMFSGSNPNIVMNGNGGNITVTGEVSADVLRSTGGTVATSDARFKKNVKSIDGALAKTHQLNGYTYNWNKLAKKQKGIDNKEEQVGVLAQELETVFPQLVKTDDEGYKSVNYAALTAVLIEAVKELSEQVTNLQGENAELKAELTKVDELEIKIDLIQKILAKQTMEASQATVSR